MKITSEKFALGAGTSSLGAYALRFKSVNFLIPMNQVDLDDLFRFLGPIQEGQEIVWMRRPQGPAGPDDSSWHPCNEGDPGAVMFVGPPKC